MGIQLKTIKKLYTGKILEEALKHKEARKRELKRQASNRYYQRNKEKCHEKRRLWGIKNAEKLKKYSQDPETKERKRQNAIEWRKKHPERAKKNAHAWARKYPEKAKEYSKQYYQKNKERLKQKRNEYRKKKEEEKKLEIKKKHQKLYDPELIRYLYQRGCFPDKKV